MRLVLPLVLALAAGCATDPPATDAAPEPAPPATGAASSATAPEVPLDVFSEDTLSGTETPRAPY